MSTAERDAADRRAPGELRIRDGRTARRVAAVLAVLILASVAISLVLTIRFLDDCASGTCSDPSENTRWILLAGYVAVAVVAAGLALYVGRFARVERIWRRARGVALAYAVGSIGWSILAIVLTR